MKKDLFSLLFLAQIARDSILDILDILHKFALLCMEKLYIKY